MSANELIQNSTTTLSFEAFWEWIQSHYNCIVRAGTTDAVFFDDDAYHWRFAALEVDTWVVQLNEGKRTIGEMAVIPSRVTYVQVQPGDDGEVHFELVAETEEMREVVYFFVLAHAYDVEENISETWVN